MAFKRLPFIVFLFYVAPAHAGFYELDPTLQKTLAKILVYTPTSGDAGSFKDWYNRFYCTRSEVCFPNGTTPPESVYPKFRFESLSIEEKVSLACTSRSLNKDLGQNFSDHLGRNTWVVKQGELVFDPAKDDADGAKLQEFLKSKGFTNNFNAGGRGKKWGLRSPYEGAFLHVYMGGDGSVHVHIDYSNPGRNELFVEHESKGPVGDTLLFIPNLIGRSLDTAGKGISHTIDDLNGWNDRFAAYQVVESGSDCGLGAPELRQVMEAAHTSSSQKRKLLEMLKSKPETAVPVEGTSSSPSNHR